MTDHHEPDDFEDLEPIPLTPEHAADMARLAAIVDLLDEYGFTYTEEPGWEHRMETYQWSDGAPYGLMVHHTATASYNVKSAYPKPEGNRTDGRVICNALIQPGGVINMIAAGPANYSSGTGRRDIRDNHVIKGVKFNGPQTQNDDSPAFYGNREYINIEVVHKGDGSAIPEAQEDALIGLLASVCYLFDWDSTKIIGHYDHTRRKIDPKWIGAYSGSPYSIEGIQDKVQEILDTSSKPQPQRAPNYDEALPHQQASWQKAWEWKNSLINKDTRPADVLTKGDMFIFYDRMGFFD